jgi:hypothetical protein
MAKPNPDTHCTTCGEPLSLFGHCWQHDYPPMDPKQDPPIPVHLNEQRLPHGLRRNSLGDVIDESDGVTLEQCEHCGDWCLPDEVHAVHGCVCDCCAPRLGILRA